MNTTKFAITLAGIACRSAAWPRAGRSVRRRLRRRALRPQRQPRAPPSRSPTPATWTWRPTRRGWTCACRRSPTRPRSPTRSSRSRPRSRCSWWAGSTARPSGPRSPCSTTPGSSRGRACRSRWRCRSTSRSSAAASTRSPTTCTPKTTPATSGTSARTSTTSSTARIGDTHGTWIAGIDGPAAMIMPADPRPGDVYRPENIPGLVVRGGHRQEDRPAVPGPVRERVRRRGDLGAAHGRHAASARPSRRGTASSSPPAAATPRRWRSRCRPTRPRARCPRRSGGSTRAAMTAYAAAMQGDGGAVDRAAWRRARPGGRVGRGEVPRLLRPLLRGAVARLDTADGRRTGGSGGDRPHAAGAGPAAALPIAPTPSTCSASTPGSPRCCSTSAQRRSTAVRGDFFAIDYVRDRVRDSFGEGLRAEVDLALEELLDAIHEGDLGSVRAGRERSCGALIR